MSHARALLVALFCLAPFLNGAGLVGTAVSNSGAATPTVQTILATAANSLNSSTDGAVGYIGLAGGSGQGGVHPATQILYPDGSNPATYRGSVFPAGTISNWRGRSNCDTATFDIDNDVGTNSIEFMVMQNGSPTTMFCTVTGSAGADEECVNDAGASTPLNIADGDWLALRLTHVETGGGNLTTCGVSWSFDFTPTTPNTTIFAGQATTAVVKYLMPGVAATGASANYYSTTESLVSAVVPMEGTISGLMCRAADGITGDTTFRVFKNGSVEATFDCTIPSESTTAVIVRPTAVSVAVGDTISIQHSAGTDATGNAFITLEFKPTDTGKWWKAAVLDTYTLVATKNYMPIGGYKILDAAMNNQKPFWPPSNINFESLYVVMGAALAGADTLTIAIGTHAEDPPNSNSVSDTTLAVTFADGSGTTLTDTDAFSVTADQYYEISALPADSPPGTTVKISTVFSRD